MAELITALSDIGIGRPAHTESIRSWDPTGKAITGSVLNDDTFLSGPCGFGQLFTPKGTAAGWSGGTISHLTDFSPRVTVRTGDVGRNGTTGEGTGGLIKRLMNAYGDGRYLFDAKVSLEVLNYDELRPDYWLFALDTCLPNGTRRLFEFRIENWNSTSSLATFKIQLNKGDGTYFDTGAVYVPNYNENKLMTFDVSFEIDTALGLFLGLKIDNSVALGSLAATPSDTAIPAMYVANAVSSPAQAVTEMQGGQVISTYLPRFAGGINPFLQVYNRSASTQTAGLLNLHRQRTTRLDGKSRSTPHYPGPMQSSIRNYLFSNWPMSNGTIINTPPIECNPGEEITYDILVESIAGVPTSASLAAQFEVVPHSHKGLTIHSYTSSILPTWIPIVAADGYLDHLQNAVFPANLLTGLALTAGTDDRKRIVSRSLKVTSLGSLNRMKLTAALAGGTTPTVSVTVAAAVSKRLRDA